MVSQFVASLSPAVSRVRLEAYRPAGASDLEMAVNYFLNIELSEALYPSLQSFEIALRNTVHAVLSSHFSTEFWFDRPAFLLAWQSKAVQGARDELSKHNKPHEAGRIVAELSFGFWHSMFNRPYEARLWHGGGAALLELAFPNLPRTLRTRQVVWDRCEQIRTLRNRVFHYEPVWVRRLLHDEHTQILEALGWINAEMRDAIAMCDRFDAVYLVGRSEVEAKILKRVDEASDRSETSL